MPRKPAFLYAAALMGVCLCSAETRLGQTLTLSQPVSVDQLLAAPGTTVGKTVQVAGKVSEVCQMQGCWMQLTGSGKNGVRIKVNDGDLVFPKSAIGKNAIAEGKLSKLDLTREQAVARAKHEAEEGGRTFNPASVKSGASFYQIQGAGAVILD